MIDVYDNIKEFFDISEKIKTDTNSLEELIVFELLSDQLINYLTIFIETINNKILELNNNIDQLIKDRECNSYISNLGFIREDSLTLENLYIVIKDWINIKNHIVELKTIM